MNSVRPLVTICLCAFIAACGVSPKVRVEPVAGTIRPLAPIKSSARAADDVHVVVRGDTLYSIAFRNGLDVRDLIAWNALQAPYTIYPGQALRLYARQAASDSISSAAPATSAPPTSALPVAASGTTSTALGTQAVVDHSQPVQVEALGSPEAGSPLAVAPPPLPTRPSPVAATQPRPAGALASAIGVPAQTGSPAQSSGAASGVGTRSAAVPLVAASAVRPPLTSASSAATASAVVVPDAASRATDVASAPSQSSPRAVVAIDSSASTALREGVRWRWPSAGNVLGRFVAGDPTQQGIDIAGKLGQPVVAVADGEVVYSGNGLLGYGEMIIVQHSPDYLSAYGHNQRRLAAEGAKVKAGQIIAEMGQRGSQVMLHFEVRRRGKPVDPLSYLPAR